MLDLKNLHDAMSAARNALAGDDDQLAELAVWNMCEVFERDFNVNSEEEYSPDLALIQYQCLDVIMDLHIRRGDPTDISIQFARFAKRYHQEREHCNSWTEADWKPIMDVIDGIVRKTYAFNQKCIIGDYKPKERDENCICELCRKRKADKTGSHMVPHLLISKIFSYDGSTKRDKVTVTVNNLGESKNEHYFGHEVYDDTIKQILGRVLSDEELEAEVEKTNALTIDHIFCSECEKRFGVIESLYADVINGKKDYPPQIPYLFWISVVWRMAVGDMGMVMDVRHQEKLRKVLNQCLALHKDEVVLKQSKLGYCAYSLYKAEDTRDETLGIFGPLEVTKPYQALMGRYFINFYNSVTAARSFIKAHDLPMDDLNDGTQPEKVGNLNFIEFWLVKRQILDMAWKNGRSIWNIGRHSQRTLSKMENFPEDKNEQASDDIPLWLNSENPYTVNIPRSLKKIMDWIEEHKDNWSIEALSEAVGYTQEEIAVMLDYWNDVASKKAKQMEQGEQYMEALNAFMDENGLNI